MKAHWWILILIALVVIIGVGWSMAQPDATVVVIQPQVQSIRAYVEEQAVTELPHDYLVATPIAGWLEPIRLREGDQVEEGQVVARLDTDDLQDQARQVEQRIAILETELARTADNRLEENALVETRATVKAIDETVAAAEKKLDASLAVLEFAESEVQRLRGLIETDAAAARELRAAETAWRKARAEYQSDALELAALKTLAAVSYIGPKFITDYIDRKQFELRSLQQQLEQARAQLQIEKRNLERAVMHAPITGVVLRRHQTRRQFLPAGTPLLTLGRLSDLEVKAEVLTQRATRIRAGDPVEIFGQAILDGPLSGQVLRVYPAGFKEISSLGVEQQRVNVAIELDRRPPELGVAYRVQVRIFHDQADDALTLPRTTLFRGAAGQWQVMIVDSGNTALRDIEVGLMNDQHAQVVSGLEPTSLVIAHPSRDITPGMHVNTAHRVD